MNWRKVNKCKHENVTDYYASGTCGTPLCSGWIEEHCRDCGAYVCKCPCMSCSGESGWSHRRWQKHHESVPAHKEKTNATA